jgi:hypothetical protein
MDNVVKFPHSASRRVMSRRPRRAKNGTPEERAAKAAVAAGKSRLIADAIQRGASVVKISGRSGANRRLAEASVADRPFIEFMQRLGAYVVKEFATGKEVDQIFNQLIAEALERGRRR